MSVEQMEFPETFEKFAKEYGFKDDKEVYTNGSYLIPIFRVKQWLEHDNKLRAIEIDAAYECGKAALDKVRAEIEHVIDYTYDSTDYDKALYNGAYKDGLYEALDIIDKYI